MTLQPTFVWSYYYISSYQPAAGRRTPCLFFLAVPRCRLSIATTLTLTIVLPQVLRCSGAITSYELVCICIIIMNIMHTTTRTSYIIIMHNIMDSIYVFMCIICILCIEYPYKSTRLPYYAYYPYSIRSTSRVILGKGTVCIQLNNTSYSSNSRSITMPRCCTLS